MSVTRKSFLIERKKSMMSVTRKSFLRERMNDGAAITPGRLKGRGLSQPKHARTTFSSPDLPEQIEG